MNNVLLLGDSIRQGYQKAVKKTLEGKANVYYPEENCRFASFLLRNLHVYKELAPNGKVDVLHWNAGLWDCIRIFEEEPHTPIDVYAYYIDRVCIRIKKLFPETTVIFATSTSVVSEKMNKDFMRYNEDIIEYNKRAVAIVKEYGFIVNDLFSTSLTLDESAHNDPVHYNTPAATKAFTEQVVSCIAPALGITENITYQEALYNDKPIGI